MKLELYAPIDCEINYISKSSDSVFADKMLGDGIFILPKNKKDNFKSPFLDAKISQVFDTNHAMWFSVNDINVLIHCGLETVSLNGDPFEIKVKIGDSVKNNDTLFSVDWEFIKNKNLSCETPIVFEKNSNLKIDVKLLKNEAKQGEKIAEVTFTKNEQAILNNENVIRNDNFEIATFKNKYRKAAEAIYKYIGEGNYKNVYHCMTRFRTNITDQSKVNLEQIKKIDVVKGAQYNGSELQIIIGGEVSKVVDEFKAYENEPKGENKNKEEIKLQNKISPGKKILGAVAGIMGPSIPAIMASGMFGAIYAILLQSKLVDNLSDISQIKDTDMLTGLVFVLNKVILNALGVFVLFNFVKYFGGETMYAIGVGLILSSRAFFPGTPMDDAEWAVATFGDWVNHGGKQGYLLFKLGDLPIVIGGYEGSVLPYVAAAALLIYINKFVKSWMPSVIDIVFRPMLVVGASVLGSWLLFGPLMGLIEFGLVTGLTEAGKLPGGIGVGIMALIWQPLVLTGAHVGVVMPLVVAISGGEPQLLMAGVSIGTWAQIGAVVGVALATKNFTVKSLAWGASVGGVFGITEPIIYGVTLPRFKPFMLGCAVAFPVGMLSGILGLDADGPAGLGIFGIFAYQDGISEQLLVGLTWILVIGLTAVAVYFTNTERKNEYNESKKVIKMITLLNVSKKNRPEFKAELLANTDKFSDELDKVKSLKQLFKDYENHISSITKFEAMLVSLENKESNERERQYKKLVKLRSSLLKNSKPEVVAQFNKLNMEYESFSLEDKKDEVNKKINNAKVKFENSLQNLRKLRNQIMEDFSSKIPSNIDGTKIQIMKNQIWNAMHSVEIGFGMEDERANKLLIKGEK